MDNKSKKILSEISPGELLDKVSILEIKLIKIKDENNLIEIKKEYKSLKKTLDLNIELTSELKILIKDVKDVNLKLWEIEDQIRICEKKRDFTKKFVDLSRSVYLNNDKRAKIKLMINKLLNSNIKEIKQYIDY